MKILRREMAKQRDIIGARLGIIVLAMMVYIFILSRMIKIVCETNYMMGTLSSVADMIKSSLYRQTVFFVYIPVLLIYVYEMTSREIKSGRIVRFVNWKNYAKTLCYEKILCVISLTVVIALSSTILSMIVSGGKRIINFNETASAYFKETGVTNNMPFIRFELIYVLYMIVIFYCIISIYNIIRLLTGKFMLSYIICVVAGIIIEFLRIDEVISFNYTNIGNIGVIMMMYIIAAIFTGVEYLTVSYAVKKRDFL